MKWDNRKHVKETLELAKMKAELLHRLESERLQPGTMNGSTSLAVDIIREIERALEYLSQPRCE